MSQAGYVARVGDRRSAYRILVGRPEGKRPLGRLKLGWEDNIMNGSSKGGMRVWTGLIWLRVGTGSELLCRR
jgi:hypothetical protein